MPVEPTNQGTATAGSARLNVVAEERHDNSIFDPAGAVDAALAGTRIVGSSLDGVIDAAVVPMDRPYYGYEMPMLISGRSLGAISLRGTATLRAADLVAELREISGQVNRMMSQVERAIDHLAVHAW
jgi:hypothetical protein